MKYATLIYNDGTTMPYQCEGHTSIETVINDARQSAPEQATAVRLLVYRATTPWITL